MNIACVQLFANVENFQILLKTHFKAGGRTACSGSQHGRRSLSLEAVCLLFVHVLGMHEVSLLLVLYSLLACFLGIY
jgi:hypothetical protein